MSSVSDRFEVGDWLRSACDDGEPTAVMTVGADRDVFIEGRGTDFTCAASLQLDAAANVARSLFFRCDRVAPPAPFEPEPRPPVLPLLTDYFTALNDGEFAAAAEFFSTDCLYVHPPYRPGEPQAEFRGRDQLVRLWPQPSRRQESRDRDPGLRAAGQSRVRRGRGRRRLVPLHDRAGPRRPDQPLRGVSTPRVGCPASRITVNLRASPLAAFPASDDARWITGHVLPVDGGFHAR